MIAMASTVSPQGTLSRMPLELLKPNFTECMYHLKNVFQLVIIEKNMYIYDFRFHTTFKQSDLQA